MTQELILRAWEEDQIQEDVTSQCLGAAGNQKGQALLFAKAPGVFSGSEVIEAHQKLLPDMSWNQKVVEGQRLEIGQPLLEMTGTYGEFLRIERTLLNLLSHLCGVATKTAGFVGLIKPHRAQLLCTRKTIPGLRHLQLQAVVAGGGKIHRRSLSDGILIKENHSAIVPIEKLMETAKESRSPLHRIEVEVQSMEFLERVLKLQPDIIMLDNFAISELPAALEKIAGRCLVEVSGGVNLETISQIAATGVDFISVGELTHSIQALDLSLDIL